jgi:cysteine protease ATG4
MDNSIWLLGKQYKLSIQNNFSQFLNDFKKNIISFTYRNNFQNPLNNILISDAGWGCMLRSSQMLLAQTLLRHLKMSEEKIIPLFKDHELAPYSIHNISKNKIGQWFGPSEVSHIIKEHVNLTHKSLLVNIIKDYGIYKDECILKENEGLLLLIPIRFSIDDKIEKGEYTNQLISFLQLSQSVGIIGGKPKSSYYFCGCQGDNILYYIDPHKCQKVSDDLSTYHVNEPCINDLNTNAIDPCVLIGFYCKSNDDFNDLCNNIDKLKKKNNIIINCADYKPNYDYLDIGDSDDF